MTNPSPEQQLQFAFNAGVGPDGKTWAVLGIMSGAMTNQVMIPPDAFDQMAQKIPAELSKLNAHIRRANLGLVIKTDLNGVKP